MYQATGFLKKIPALTSPHRDLCAHQHPTCSVSETGRGRVRGLGPRAWGAYRRRGQAGPPDGLGAGVQRRVLVLREGGMHGKVRLLAVHGHHLEGLACKSNKHSESPRQSPHPGSPGLPSEAAASEAGGAEAAATRGAAAAAAVPAAAAAARRSLGPRSAPRTEPTSPRALAPRADGMRSSYTCAPLLAAGPGSSRESSRPSRADSHQLSRSV